jgi:hypothetical protein
MLAKVWLVCCSDANFKPEIQIGFNLKLCDIILNYYEFYTSLVK